MKSDQAEVRNTDVEPPPSIWRLGGLKWRDLAWRVWDELVYGHILVHAAAKAGVPGAKLHGERDPHEHEIVSGF